MQKMLQYPPHRIDVDKAMRHQCFADLHQGNHAEALRGACGEPLNACSEMDVASLDETDVASLDETNVASLDAATHTVELLDDVEFTSQHALMQDAERGALRSECSRYAAHDAQPSSALRRRVVHRSAITPFNSPAGSTGKRKQKRHIRDRDQPIIASLHSPSRP